MAVVLAVASLLADSPVRPDYLGIEIPPNIAPLNFRLASGAGGTASMKAADGSRIETAAKDGGVFAWNAREWRKFLESHRGESVEVRISSVGRGADVVATNAISTAPIDTHLTYRLIEPSYGHFGEMGI